MKNMTIILVVLLMTGCSMLEDSSVTVAKIELEKARLHAEMTLINNREERAKEERLKTIEVVNKPQEFVAINGEFDFRCTLEQKSTGNCGLAVYNPFHKPKLPTNEWDYKMSRNNAIAGTIKSIFPWFIGGNVIQNAQDNLKALGVAGIAGAGNNSYVSDSYNQTSTNTDSNNQTTTSTHTEDNDTTTSTNTTTTTTTTTTTSSDDSSNSGNTTTTTSSEDTTTTTTTTNPPPEPEVEENP